MDLQHDSETAFELRRIYSLLWRLGLFFALSFLLVILPVVAYSGHCLYSFNREAEKLSRHIDELSADFAPGDVDSRAAEFQAQHEQLQAKMNEVQDSTKGLVEKLFSSPNREGAARLQGERLRQRRSLEAENNRRQMFQIPPKSAPK